MIGQAERQQLLHEGYLVVPEVVPASLCDAVVNAILEFTGVDPDDPETWYQERFKGLGVVPLHHHQALWDVRQYPAVHDVFRALYETEALWVTMDRVGYKPPASERSRDWRRHAVHWDCDPWTFDGFAVQGLVYLTDTSPAQGAFCCVPAIYRNLSQWRADHAGDENRRHPRVDDDDLVAVGGKSGSLVVFHRLMPHSNLVNRTEKPRFVQYVTMQPEGGDEERRERIELWRSNMPPPWAVRQKVPGQEMPEPGPAAELTTLGRKLVGIDTWG